MSDPGDTENPSKPFSALAYEAHADADALSLSDSDPGLSDEADIAYNSAEEDDDLEEDYDQHRVQQPPVQPFTLKGTDDTFSKRSQGIFGALKDVPMCMPSVPDLGKAEHDSDSSDKETDETSQPPKESGKSSTKDRRETDLNTGKGSVVSQESSVAKPAKPRSALPDYLKHPERWTKYSLEHVPPSSDQSNRKTALSFLADLKHKQQGVTLPQDPKVVSFNQDSSSSAEGKIIFSRPNKASRGIGEKSESHSPHLNISGGWDEEGNEKSDGKTEQAESESLGFHSLKKRNRKNIRTKADDGRD
uniref:U5 small nuclear ribonucleoprotein TSSC4 n=1 Tax=Leptobrachium leishanense TaxID=445787 RepID=A0A8C5R089_9ANUR